MNPYPELHPVLSTGDLEKAPDLVSDLEESQ